MKELEESKQYLASLGNDLAAISQELKALIQDRRVIRDRSIEFAERAILLGAKVDRMREDMDEALGSICAADCVVDADEIIDSLTPDAEVIPLDHVGGRGF